MSLKSRLAADETLVTAWSGVPDALTVEILAKQGFDAITLDMQHGGHHEDSVLRGLMPVQPQVFLICSIACAISSSMVRRI